MFLLFFFLILANCILTQSLTTSSWPIIPAIRSGFVILETQWSLHLVKRSIANMVLRNSLPQRLLTRHQSPRQLTSGKPPGAYSTSQNKNILYRQECHEYANIFFFPQAGWRLDLSVVGWLLVSHIWYKYVNF